MKKFGKTQKEQLVDYFKKNIRKEYTPETLKWSLIKQGYSRSIVESAQIKAQKELAEKAPKFKEKPAIKYEVIDSKNKPVRIKKNFWERIKEIFKQ